MADKKPKNGGERFVVVTEAEFKKQVKKPRKSTSTKGKK